MHIIHGYEKRCSTPPAQAMQRVAPAYKKDLHGVALARRIPMRRVLAAVIGALCHGSVMAQDTPYQLPGSTTELKLESYAGNTDFEVPQNTTITSSSNGISGDNSHDWTLTNNGNVTSTKSGGYGIYLDSASTGSTLTNNGSITNKENGSYAIYLSAPTGTVSLFNTTAATIKGGVQVAKGGFTGDNKGLISGNRFGISIANTEASTLTNSGTITVDSADTLQGSENYVHTIAATGSANLTINNSGEISAATKGYNVHTISVGATGMNTVATIDNSGIIIVRADNANAGDNAAAINVAASGTLHITNRATGQITTYDAANDRTTAIGIYIDPTAGKDNTITNEGSIYGSTTGVRIEQNTVLNNDNGGSITGTNAILIKGGAASAPTVKTTIYNGASTDIQGTSNGILISGNASLTLTNKGTITGKGAITGDTAIGLSIGAGANANTITNNGTISGTTYAIDIQSDNNTVTLGDGSQLEGDATVGTGHSNNALILTGSASEDSNLDGFSTLSMEGKQWQLSGQVTTTGSTTVKTGALSINGHLNSSSVTIDAGATLGGVGTVTGDVIVASGAHLAPGAAEGQIGTLTVEGGLNLQQGSQLNFDFGNPGASALQPGTGDNIQVHGLLTLDGAVLNINDTGGFGPGLYHLFSYDTLDQKSGLSLGGTTTTNLSLQYLNTDKQINLIYAPADTTLNVWNGNGQAAPGQLGGGDGTWARLAPSWADTTGTYTNLVLSQPGVAIFAGQAGTVNIDNSQGAIQTKGLQFASNGYTLSGDPLTLVAAADGKATIRVGDGSTAGQAYTATIHSVLAGNAGLEKTDAGTLLLTADNTYTGDTTLSGGTLSVAKDSQLGAASGALYLNGGVLQVTGTGFDHTARNITLESKGGGFDIADASHTFTVNQPLSGSGLLIKRGAGTLVLTGANTYSGGTRIDEGILQGDTHSLQGTIVNQGTLAFEQSSDGIFQGAISGAGALTKRGAGTLTLTGANSYSGNTAIEAGTLILDQSDARVYSGIISGSGQLVKSGTGTLTLNGDHTFTGATTVSSGKLLVGDDSHTNAKLGGPVTVAQGATLGGHGHIGALTLAGTIAPGDQSIGTLSIDGDATFEPGAIYRVEANAQGASDAITVHGKAILGDKNASVKIQADPGTWSSEKTYTILTASDGIEGEFAGVTQDKDKELAFLTPILSYDLPNAKVILTLDRNNVQFADVARSTNQRSVAQAIDALDVLSPLYQAILHMDEASARDALNQLDGDLHVTTRTALLEDGRYVREAINRHLLGLENGTRDRTARAGDVSAWTSLWGHEGDQNADKGNAESLRSSGSGLLLGADRAITTGMRLGALLGKGQSSIRLPNDSANAAVTYTGLYASGAWNHWQLQTAMTYAWQRIDSHRRLTAPGVAGSAQASYRAQLWQAYAEGSRVFNLRQGRVEPFLNLARAQLRSQAAQEHGDSPGILTLHGKRSAVNYTTLGMRGQLNIDHDSRTRVLASLGWRYAWGKLTPHISQRFQQGGPDFMVQGQPIARHALVSSLGLSFDPSPHISIDASYQGQFANAAKDQGAQLNLNLHW